MLVVNIGGDNSKLNQVITQSTAQIQAFAARVEASMGSVASSAIVFEGVQMAVHKLLSVLESFPEGIHAAFEVGEKLDNVSARTGIAAGQVQILQKAFSECGIEADKVGPAVNKMQKAIAEAAGGGKEAGAKFDQLGLSIEELIGMAPDKQFEEIGRAINAISDPAYRAKAAIDIFGKSGGEMLALFAKPEALEAAAEALGGQVGILNEKSAEFHEIADLLGEGGIKLQGFFVGLADSIGPKLLPILERFKSADFSSFGKSIGSDLAGFVSGIASALPLLASLTTGIFLARTGLLSFAATGPAVGASIAGGMRLAATAALELQARNLGLSVSWMNVGASFTASLATMRVGLTSLAASVASAAGSILAALGPVNIALMAATFGYGKLMEKTATINAGTDAVKAVGKETDADFTGDVSKMKALTSEQERAAMLKELEDRLIKVKTRAGNLEEEFSNLDDDGIKRVETALGNQQWTIEKTIAQVQKLTPEFLAANAASRPAIDGTTESLKEQAEAAKRLADEQKQMVKDRRAAKNKASDFRDEMEMEQAPHANQKRDILLKQSGAKDAADMDKQIDGLQQLINLGNASTIPEEIARLDLLMAARKKLLTLDQQIADAAKEKAEADRKQAEADAKSSKKALDKGQSEIDILKAEVSGDPEKLKQVKRDKRQRELEQGFIDDKVDPETAKKKAREIVDLEAQRDEAANASKAAPIASSLAKVGGGGNVGGLGGISLQKEANSHLKKVAENTAKTIEAVTRLASGSSTPALTYS